MKRTDDQIRNDYLEFRGKCKSLSEQAILDDPSLTLIRGYYFCPIWASEEPHWWTVRKDGSIYDPSARQFPSNGHGFYTEFDGNIECSNCGKIVKEEDASFDSNYAFCSNRCHGQFIGIY